MDAIDVKIIKRLRKNARENASEIGNAVNMSVSAVIERIKKLESSGVIKRYEAVLDNEKLGLNTTAFICVSMERPKYNDGFADFVSTCPRIEECHYITGDFDFLLKVCADGREGLARLLNEIKFVKGVSSTKTVMALSTVKENCGADVDFDP